MAVFAFIKRLAMTGVAKSADWSFQQDPHLKFHYMKQKPPLFSKCDSWQNKGRVFKGEAFESLIGKQVFLYFANTIQTFFLKIPMFFHARTTLGMQCFGFPPLPEQCFGLTLLIVY